MGGWGHPDREIYSGARRSLRFSLVQQRRNGGRVQRLDEVAVQSALPPNADAIQSNPRVSKTLRRFVGSRGGATSTRRSPFDPLT